MSRRTIPDFFRQQRYTPYRHAGPIPLHRRVAAAVELARISSGATKRSAVAAFGAAHAYWSGSGGNPKHRRLTTAPGAHLPRIMPVRMSRAWSKKYAAVHRAGRAKNRRVMRAYRKRTGRRRRRVGRKRRMVSVGLHWPPSVMRWSGTTQVTLTPTEHANDDTNVAVFSMEGTVAGHVGTYFAGLTGGAVTNVNFSTPRNFSNIAAMYEQMRIVKITFTIQFINQNDFENFKVYYWTNTTTNRNEPILLMGPGTSKPGTSPPWDDVDGVTKILDQARSISRITVGSANDTASSKRTIRITFGKNSFTGPDRWGVRNLGGRFNTDGTGPGLPMGIAVAGVDTSFGLAPMIHFAVTNLTKANSSPDITTIEVKKTVTVEFFNRVMNLGAA